MLAVVTCKATPLICAGAGEDVAERGCFRLDFRGRYDDGEGNSCKGVDVEGVFEEDMVPDRCQSVERTKRKQAERNEKGIDARKQLTCLGFCRMGEDSSSICFP